MNNQNILHQRILESSFHYFKFLGEGVQLFKILLVNFFFNIVSLGLYYPWSRVNYLKYLYQETEFSGSRFHFSGTGSEMFRGYIKIYGIFMFFGIGLFFTNFINLKVGYYIILIFFYIVLAFIVPFAMHGMVRYRLSRSSWRSIRFGYRGDRDELVKLYFKSSILVLLTFGIYYPWMYIKLRRYIVDHMRFGDAEFKYLGDGIELFMIYLKGFLLMLITFGIYFFWLKRNIFVYHATHTRMYHQGEELTFESPMTGGNLFGFKLINLLINLISLGLGYAWIQVRSLKFLFSNLRLKGRFDTDLLLQTEVPYLNATGEEFLEQADLEIGII